MVMQRARETDAKRHHLVSQGYMRRFSPDGERVHVYDRLTGRFRFSKTKSVAAQTEFYTVKKRDGAKLRWVEWRLAEIDGAVGTFDELERGEELTREERFHVAIFAGFADSRGVGFRSTAPPLHARHNPEDDEQFIAGFAEVFSRVTKVHLEPWVMKSMVLADVADLAEGFDETSAMIAHGMELGMQFFRSDWYVGNAPEGLMFITSDRPIGLITRNSQLGHDAFDPETFHVLPLSPRAALCVGSPSEHPMTAHVDVDAYAVRGSNIAIARRADRNLIASSEGELRGVLHAIGSRLESAKGDESS